MVSGTWMGEIVRLVLVKLAKQGLLFDGVATSQLLMKECFETKDISAMEDDRDGLDAALKILKSLGLNPSEQDCKQVQRVCNTVSSSSATVSGAGLAAVINRMQNSYQDPTRRVTVGVDGFVYKIPIE